MTVEVEVDEMNDANMKVLINVIGAVESGGQIYGNRRYEAYAAPYTNSPNEHTITLGWAQNYGYAAKELIQAIYNKDSAGFKKIDTSGSIQGMLSKDWVAVRWNPSATQKQILIKLITSTAGKQCQDELFAKQMKSIIADCEKDYTKDVKAVMMYCEIRHLGGKSPTDRIFKRCNGNYSLDNIMASLKKDQSDTSNNNQVGDAIYWSRHQKCREFIDKYAVAESSAKQEGSSMTQTEKAIQYMEKIARDNTHGYSQYNRWGQPDFDCSSLVVTAWQTGAGVPVKSAGATYTGNMYNAFIACGFKDVTSKINLATGKGLIRGDVLLNVSHHTAMYCGNGLEVEAASDEYGGIRGANAGDNTGYEILIQNYRNYPWTHVLRYKDAEEQPDNSLKKGSKGTAVKKMQALLIAVGYSCGTSGADGVFGDDTEKAVKKFQKAKGLTQSGTYNSATEKALAKEYETKSAVGWTKKGTAICSHDDTTLRMKPKNGVLLTKLKCGKSFEYDGKTSGSWSHVKVSGIGVAWILTSRVVKKTTWKAVNTAICTGNDVKFRATASSADEKNIIGRVTKGQRFEVDGKLSKSKNWVHAKHADLGVGWIHKKYVKYDNQ